MRLLSMCGGGGGEGKCDVLPVPMVTATMKSSVLRPPQNMPTADSGTETPDVFTLLGSRCF